MGKLLVKKHQRMSCFTVVAVLGSGRAMGMGILLFTSSATEKSSLDVERQWTSEPGKGKVMMTSCFLGQCFE